MYAVADGKHKTGRLIVQVGVSLVPAKKFVKSQLPLNPHKPQQQQNATYFVARIPVLRKTHLVVVL